MVVTGKLTSKEVLSVVERMSGFSDITVRSKGRDLPLWRGLYCKLACELTLEPRTRIGELIGRDHSTVTYWNGAFKNLFYTRTDMEEAYIFAKKELEAVRLRKSRLKWIDVQAEKIIESMLL